MRDREVLCGRVGGLGVLWVLGGILWVMRRELGVLWVMGGG